MHVLPLAPSIAVNRVSTHSVENALFRTRFFAAASGDRIFFHSSFLFPHHVHASISGSHMTITIIIVFRGGLSVKKNVRVRLFAHMPTPSRDMQVLILYMQLSDRGESKNSQTSKPYSNDGMRTSVLSIESPAFYRAVLSST